MVAGGPCGRFRSIPGHLGRLIGGSAAIASQVDEATADRSTAAPLITRRNFIVWYLAALLTAFAVIIIAPILVFVYPPAGSTKKIDIPVDLKTPLDQMQDGEVQGFNAPKETGFTMTNGGGDNYAGKIGFAGFVVKNGSDFTVLSSTCSHLGCSVAPNTSGAKRFDCPCHGSQFILNGQVLHGPASAPLSNYDWKKVENNPAQIKVVGVSLPGQ